MARPGEQAAADGFDTEARDARDTGDAGDARDAGDAHGRRETPEVPDPGDDPAARSGEVISVRYLQVQTTTDSRAEAMDLAHAAVAARLAACAQVAGPVASTFWWEDSLERAEEWLVMLKLPADRYAELAEFISERHSYDEPEIVATPIVAGSPSYLSWIAEETRPEAG